MAASGGRGPLPPAAGCHPGGSSPERRVAARARRPAPPATTLLLLPPAACSPSPSRPPPRLWLTGECGRPRRPPFPAPLSGAQTLRHLRAQPGPPPPRAVAPQWGCGQGLEQEDRGGKGRAGLWSWAGRPGGGLEGSGAAVWAAVSAVRCRRLARPVPSSGAPALAPPPSPSYSGLFRMKLPARSLLEP